jgi:hypothetical protein
MPENKLSLMEAVALEKIGEKQKKSLQDLPDDVREKIPAGGHRIDFDCRVSGVLTKGEDTLQYPPFKAENSLRTLLLAALTLDGNPLKALGKAVETVPKLRISPQSQDIMDSQIDRYLDSAKAEFQSKSDKVTRAGNTSFTGSVEKL